MPQRGLQALGWPTVTAALLIIVFMVSLGSVLSKGSLGSPANSGIQAIVPVPEIRRANDNATASSRESIVAKTPGPENIVPEDRVVRIDDVAISARQSIVAKTPRPENIVPEDRVARLDDGAQQMRQPNPVIPRNRPVKQAKTALIDFKSAPFPYNGVIAGTDRPFLNVSRGRDRGHRTSGGRVLWEKETYNDRRALLHIPSGFDVNRPGVMIVFFHGHGATLERDVLNRQQVPAQIAASGTNAVLVAPQFAVDASDSSAGRFSEPGAFGRFVREAAIQLARLNGDPATARKFAKMPVVIVAYSGGYLPAALSVDRGGLKGRLRGVVLLDALYGELDKFASWITNNRSTFFVSSYTSSTRRQNAELERILAERDVKLSSVLNQKNVRGAVTFLATGPDVDHRDFVTRAWVDDPIKDVLTRLAEYRH